MLSGIPQEIFHGVLDEFKRLARIPPGPVDRPRKVEMEQFYQGERILLRLRVMPGQYGEEGTLQVLRGQALIFYQQQQMDELGQEAIEAAQRLERKLRHIYLRSQINPSSLNALDELYGFCDRLRDQLDNIRRRQ
jgi:type II secretory ATPase GspE/PulE/Tfp pilus assembly ATPase PilB-like protein